jgi:hypothetical protein
MAEIVTTELVTIDTLNPYPGNARRGDVERIRESLRVNGQYRPIVVQADTNYILAGNHTWMAAMEEGWSDIAVTYVKCDDVEARRIVLVDNKSNDDAAYNDEALADLLKQLDGNFEGTGFEAADLDNLLTTLGSDDFEAVLGGLAGDKPEFVTMSFTLHEEQKRSIDEAMELANDMGEYVDTGNENKNGNALARVAEMFLGQYKSDADSV